MRRFQLCMNRTARTATHVCLLQPCYKNGLRVRTGIVLHARVRVAIVPDCKAGRASGHRGRGPAPGCSNKRNILDLSFGRLLVGRISMSSILLDLGNTKLVHCF